MKYAKIRLTWKPTKDPRVIEHLVQTYMIGLAQPIDSVSLPPSTSHLDIVLPEFTQVHVRSTVIINDDCYTESVLDFQVPDLSRPVPIDHLGWTILEIFEKEVPNELPMVDEQTNNDMDIE